MTQLRELMFDLEDALDCADPERAWQAFRERLRICESSSRACALACRKDAEDMLQRAALHEARANTANALRHKMLEPKAS